MTYKLIIFDKDGTLVRPKSGSEFVQHPEDQELIPGVAEQLQAIAANPSNLQLAIATNQGGEAAGYKSLEAAIAEVDYAMRLANDAIGLGFSKLFVSMIAPSYETEQGEALMYFSVGSDFPSYRRQHHSASVRYRKPNPGMIAALIQCFDSGYKYLPRYQEDYYPISQRATWMIGDRPEDEQAAASAGVDFCWAADWIANGLPR